jgi:hypothetical protein
MAHLSHITAANIRQSFNLPDLLKDSVFYPCSAADGGVIKIMAKTYNSFIHVDYSCKKERIRKKMAEDFYDVGYDVIGPVSVTKILQQLPEYKGPELRMTRFEMIKYNDRSESDIIYNSGFHLPFFALWAVYRINPARTGNAAQMAQTFSILHIGGEACSWYEQLYPANKINPAVFAIVSPGDGYGNNWTRFLDTGDRMYQLLDINEEINGVPMPKIVLTDQLTPPKPLPWPGYTYVRTYHDYPTSFLSRPIRRDIYQFELRQ